MFKDVTIREVRAVKLPILFAEKTLDYSDIDFYEFRMFPKSIDLEIYPRKGAFPCVILGDFYKTHSMRDGIRLAKLFTKEFVKFSRAILPCLDLSSYENAYFISADQIIEILKQSLITLNKEGRK